MINWEDKMNNNFYEIPNDWYNEFNNNFMNNTNLSEPKNGFLRGNMFNNLYDPYKNYKYRELRANNKKEEMLYNIMMYNFILTEMDLYLDLTPDNMEVVKLYKEYLNNKLKLVNEYEKNYGPLTLDYVGNSWNWINSPWTWDGGK